MFIAGQCKLQIRQKLLQKAVMGKGKYIAHCDKIIIIIIVMMMMMMMMMTMMMMMMMMMMMIMNMMMMMMMIDLGSVAEINTTYPYDFKFSEI